MYALGQLADRVLDFRDRLGINAGERLVEQDQLRLGDERAGNLEPTALTARYAIGLRLADLGQPELVEKLVLSLDALLAIEMLARLQDRHQVVFHGQLLEDAGVLCKITHAGPRMEVHRQSRDVAAVEDDLAAIGGDQANRHPEAGGLARAVGTE